MRPHASINKQAETNAGISLRSIAASSFARLIAGAMLVLAVLIMPVAAQDPLPPPPLPVDSTPLNELLTDAERVSLASAKSDNRKRMEAYLKIGEARLNVAFTHAKNDNAPAAVKELDVYNKAMAEAGKAALGQKENKRKHSKKLEQTLYKHIKTLELIERNFPVERQPFAEDALKRAKDLRVQALNAAFAGEILKDPDELEEKKPPAKTNPPSNQLLEPVSQLNHTTRAVSLSFGRGTNYLRRAWLQIQGDYLTEEEDDRVREAQEPDKRIKVFMKIADRRLAAITGVAAPADKKSQEKAEQEKREWGAIPDQSRAELLRHYSRAIEECIVKLEDAYERNPKSSAIPKALAALRDATDKHLLILRSLTSQVNGEAEDAALRNAIEQAETANKGARDGLK